MCQDKGGLAMSFQVKVEDVVEETLLHLVQEVEEGHPDWSEDLVAEEVRREIRKHQIKVLGNQDT